ncbi:MAG TPA: hypothetical protein PKX40_02940 [Spirochaetota bacterium]|mgnify:CR=1 FL=1|jgi:hypothetical protein|nr:hypothetical protein [Spirochaetota bacterium]
MKKIQSELGREPHVNYIEWFNKLENYALKEAKGIFPWKSMPYKGNE